MFACQINDFGNKGEIKSTTVQTDFGISKAKLKIDLIRELQARSQRLEAADEVVPTRDSYSFGGNMLIAHSRFAFIEHSDLEPTDPEDLEGHVNAYEGESSLFHSFEIDEQTRQEYMDMVGTSVVLNNHDRTRTTVNIIDIVLVEDLWNEVPYYAAVLDLETEGDIYYGWTSQEEDVSFPFKHLGTTHDYESDENSQENLGLSQFQETVEFQAFKDVVDNSLDDEYLEVTTEVFENSDGIKYHVIQEKSIGNCAGLIDDLTAVYKEEKGRVTLVAMGSLEYYVRDLIDVNGDGIPEILGAEFAASSIIKLQDGGFTILQELSWSTMACPC